MNGQWKFQISTGILTRPDFIIVALGYSGHGEGVNNPGEEDVRNVGPLPEGVYAIGALEETHGHLGAHVRSLTPIPPTNTFGRSGFYIHGDNSKGDHSASEGCLVPWKLMSGQYATLRDVRDAMEGTLLVVK